jgi:hypothetical protein
VHPVYRIIFYNLIIQYTAISNKTSFFKMARIECVPANINIFPSYQKFKKPTYALYSYK